MHKQFFDPNLLAPIKTCRANSSSSFTKSAYKPLRSRIFQESSGGDLQTKEKIDYLALISPRSEFISSECRESKEEIVEMHQIKEIILLLERKRKVKSI